MFIKEVINIKSKLLKHILIVLMVIFFQTTVNAAEIELPFVPYIDPNEEIVTSSQAESEASSVEIPTDDNKSQIPNRPQTDTSNTESNRNASSENNRTENNNSQISNRPKTSTSNADSKQNASSDNNETKENILSESVSKNETPVFTPNGEEVVSIDNSTLSDTNNYPADTESITTDQSNTPEKVNVPNYAALPIIIAVLCTAVLIGAVIYTLKKKSKID